MCVCVQYVFVCVCSRSFVQYHACNAPTTFPPQLQVGASNELPESEELDALYDRFLLRRRVSQVSAGGLADLLSMSPEQADFASAANMGPLLRERDFATVR